MRARRSTLGGIAALGRRALLIGAGAALIAPASAAETAITADDMVLGAAEAPVTLIEYASTTCPSCAAFHANVWQALRARYIDAGRARLVFREFPTSPEAVALAGFQIARCRGAGAEQYFARLGVLFGEQPSIFAQTSMAGVRSRLVEIGIGFGLTRAEIGAAIDDPAGAARVRRILEGAAPFDIHSTPSFVINGRRFEGPLSGRALFDALDAAGAG